MVKQTFILYNICIVKYPKVVLSVNGNTLWSKVGRICNKLTNFSLLVSSLLVDTLKFVYLFIYLTYTKHIVHDLSNTALTVARFPLPLCLGHGISCHPCWSWNDLHCSEQLCLHLSHHSTSRSVEKTFNCHTSTFAGPDAGVVILIRLVVRNVQVEPQLQLTQANKPTYLAFQGIACILLGKGNLGVWGQ